MSVTRRTVLFSGALAAAAQEPAFRLGRPVRVALIGTVGHPGEILTPLKQAPEVRVTAFAEADDRRRAQYARNPALRDAKAYADWRELLEREELDVAAVCNENGPRAEVIRAAARRKLHVIAEKPIALTREELAGVKEDIGKAGVKLCSLLKMREDPWFLAIRNMVREGVLGEIVQVSAQKSYRYAGQDAWKMKKTTFGGTIPWIGIDLIDLMRWTSGRELSVVSAMHSRVGFPELGEIENTAACLFRLDNGGMATLRLDYLRPSSAPTHGDDRLRVAGTEGVAEYRMDSGVTLLRKGAEPAVVQALPVRRALFLEFLASAYQGKPDPIPAADLYRTAELAIDSHSKAEANRTIG